MEGSASKRGLTAYEALAPAYDDFTAGYQAATWTGKLEAKALRWGQKGRLLDVGCGTGKSFLAMIERGWEVVGSDISPAMLEIAREKVGEAVPLHAADVRELPVFGQFDLVWALNDTLNYLMSEAELEAALGRMKANLAPGGVMLFDLNTLRSMREMFTVAAKEVREVGGRAMHWSGTAAAEDVRPGTINSARFDVPGEAGASHEHSQRHFPEASVLAALQRAGLESLEVWGDFEGEQYQPLDEERHEKGIYLARAATASAAPAASSAG